MWMVSVLLDMALWCQSSILWPSTEDMHGLTRMKCQPGHEVHHIGPMMLVVSGIILFKWNLKLFSVQQFFISGLPQMFNNECVTMNMKPAFFAHSSVTCILYKSGNHWIKIPFFGDWKCCFNVVGKDIWTWKKKSVFRFTCGSVDSASLLLRSLNIIYKGADHFKINVLQKICKCYLKIFIKYSYSLLILIIIIMKGANISVGHCSRWYFLIYPFFHCGIYTFTFAVFCVLYQNTSCIFAHLCSLVCSSVWDMGFWKTSQKR